MPTISLTEKFRANCRNCSKKFVWKNTKKQAEDDADAHQNAKPAHVVDIETKTTKHTSARFR